MTFAQEIRIESDVYKRQLSSRSFRRIDIKIAAFFASIGAVVIVNQSMIYINNTVLQIDITPS